MNKRRSIILYVSLTIILLAMSTLIFIQYDNTPIPVTTAGGSGGLVISGAPSIGEGNTSGEAKIKVQPLSESILPDDPEACD